MLTQEEKVLKVLQQIPFVAASYRKIVDALKDVLPAEEVYMVLGTLVAEGKINMAMNSKGDPEYSIKWNAQVDEERKLITREFNKRFAEKTIFLPRYEGYVANLEENFFGEGYSELLDSYKELSDEYVKWQRNKKTGVVASYIYTFCNHQFETFLTRQSSIIFSSSSWYLSSSAKISSLSKRTPYNVHCKCVIKAPILQIHHLFVLIHRIASWSFGSDQYKRTTCRSKDIFLSRCNLKKCVLV